MSETLKLSNPEEGLISEWNERFRTASPQDLLAWSAEYWGDRITLTCSFGGAAGMVLLDMLVAVAPSIPVLYIDTGFLFPETYQLVEQTRERYSIQLQPVQSARNEAELVATEGDTLWERDPDRCCQIRKVQPLAEVLRPFDAWITGVRRDGSPSRLNTPLIEWSSKYRLVKLNPLAFWNEKDVWRYIFDHDVPYNPLLDQGYRSLGCMTCTRLPVNDDPRSGRWTGFDKTECGLHVENT